MQPTRQRVSSVDDFNKVGVPIGTKVWIALYDNLLVNGVISEISYSISIGDDHVWYYSWQSDEVRVNLLKRLLAAPTYTINRIFYETDIPLGHSVPMEYEGWDSVYFTLDAARAAFKRNSYHHASRRKLMRVHKKLPAWIRRRCGRADTPEQRAWIDQYIVGLDLPSRTLIKLR